MKKYYLNSNQFIKTIILVLTIFGIQYINAQGQIDSTPITNTPVTNNEGQWGPTIVITATVGGTYGASKNSLFSIVGTTTGSYRMVRVDGVGNANTDTGSYSDLDDAVNACLQNNYQRIIILEGEYSVDAPIVVDFLETTVSLPSATNVGNVGRITIEGEGFGTRIRGVGNINIFEVKSNYNSIKNRSI